jgi:hypothetical protein
MSRPASATRSSTVPRTVAALLSIICAALRASAEDIRDIRGPQFIAPAWLLPALVAGGAVLALGAYGLWRWQHRRRPAPTRLPFEVALQRLEDLRALMRPPNAREFSIAVSDIVRGYIEQGFELTATHRTTEEFLRDLLESPRAALARHRALLSEFLHQCDLVKFAGMSLTLSDMESLHHSACDFVRTTGLPEETAQILTAAALPPDGRTAHDSLPST